MVTTLVDALAALPRGDERGFRFVTARGEERYYPYRELERQAKRRGRALLALGLEPGDRVALVIPDPEEFVLSFLGATVAGLVSVPIHPRAGFSLRGRAGYTETVGHILAASGARLLLTQESAREVMAEVLPGTAVERMVFTEQWLVQEPPFCPLPRVGPDDLCFLQFTSGSTALPKGVRVSHGNLVANAQAFLGPKGLDLRADDVAVTWLPLYHDMGLIGHVLGTLICDLPTVLLPTEAFARRPNLWMETVSRYRGTITFAPNFAYALAARRVQDRELAELDLSRLRVAGCGAEPINAQVMEQFCQRFAPAGFKPQALLPCYGMAEATLAITFHDHDKPVVTDRVDAVSLTKGEARPAAPETTDRVSELVGCGHPFPGHELRIVDEEGRPLPPRRVGEIITRGPSITGGYHGLPEATTESFRDGWLYTGDLGYLADGQLFVCGRSKDLIVIHGANYHPQDIEWQVARLPGVQRQSAAAFSVPMEGGEALVVCVEGHADAVAQLERAVADRVAARVGLPVARVVVVTPGSLPRTSSGKIQRRKTRDRFLNDELEVQAALEEV